MKSDHGQSSDDNGSSNSNSSSSSADSYETESNWSVGSSLEEGDRNGIPFPDIWAAGSNLQRRHKATTGSSSAASADDHKQAMNMSRRQSRRALLSRRCCSYHMCESLSTWAVIASCSMFLYVTLVVFFAPSTSNYISDPHKTVRQRTKDRLRNGGGLVVSRRKSILDNFNIFRSETTQLRQQQTSTTKTRDSEAIPEGCVPMAWQSGNFPNCNAIHEISLPAIQRGTTAKGHYVASGLWRDVWSVSTLATVRKNATDLNDDNAQSVRVVLKILKQEHDVSDRNFDRHRRDALVMEQLTSHPYVVNIFGFCGNSIMTEALDRTLMDLIFGKKDDATPPPPPQPTRNEQLQWALDVARGVQALHQHGIAHADVQLEQFLLDNESGRIKINDFNRCRFMAVKQQVDDTSNQTTKRCTFRIPSAPGKQRSPEEYTNQELSEKIDIYATANILYAIFTQRMPWANFASAEAKRRIQQGYLQPMEDFAVDPAFVQLTYQAYAENPAQRPNASQLVGALEQLAML